MSFESSSTGCTLYLAMILRLEDTFYIEIEIQNNMIKAKYVNYFQICDVAFWRLCGPDRFKDYALHKVRYAYALFDIFSWYVGELSLVWSYRGHLGISLVTLYVSVKIWWSIFAMFENQFMSINLERFRQLVGFQFMLWVSYIFEGTIPWFEKGDLCLFYFGNWCGVYGSISCIWCIYWRCLILDGWVGWWWRSTVWETTSIELRIKGEFTKIYLNLITIITHNNMSFFEHWPCISLL